MAIISIFGAQHLYFANLIADCARPGTLNECEKTSNMINYLFGEGRTTPYEFMKSEEDEINKSIAEYQEYQQCVDSYPSDKEVIKSYSKWYSHSMNDLPEILNIIVLGELLIWEATNAITHSQCQAGINEIATNMDDFFSFRPLRIKRVFVKYSLKFSEIEQMIKARKALLIESL